jgi:NTP pyrophosphatase (non-canonical NTP hydrolase)
MIMMFENLQDKVLDWAEEKGIIENSNPLKQLEKTQEELDETKDALQKIKDLEHPDLPLSNLSKSPAYDKLQDEVADGIGDMLVTIIILAELAELDAVSCLRLAYDEIKERKGEMRDGLFVKEANL